LTKSSLDLPKNYFFLQKQFNSIKYFIFTADCWLLGCLAVILEQPALLEKIFFTTEFSINGEQGVYLVRLCHNGEWKTVVLDDYFPCYASDGQFVCAQSSRYQLWVPLIEKAMAKLNGSYEALAGGNTCESLKTLTGYPCESIYFVRGPKGAASIDSDKIWMQMLSMKENGFIMTATCNRSDVSKETYRMVGLESWHVYSVLSVCEVGNNRLVRLRNPSGKSEWRGDWSKRSSLWTPFMRQVLDEPVFNHYNPSQTDTGVFWMSFDDLAYYFTCVDVCKTRPDWFESRLSGYFSHESDQSMTVFNMIVCETCEINLSFFHKTTDKNRTEKADNDICFAIFEASTHHQKLVGKLVLSVGAGKRLIRESANCEHLFDPGQYLIVPFSFNHWYTNRGLGVVRFPFNLVIHSSKGVIVDQQMFDVRKF
jgi:calpain-15